MKIANYVKSTLAASTLFLAVCSLPATVQANNEFYQITNVRSDDSLNMRSGPGTRYPVIGTIPYNGRTVMATGESERNGRSTWVEVVWLGQIGWVNKRFLTDSDNQAPAQQMQPKVSVPMNGDPNAHTHPRNECTRSVTHAHPNGSGTHQHRYSCKPNQQQNQQIKPKTPAADPNAHTHPRNECTRSVTHTHPNGSGPHQHRYSCQPNRQQNNQVQTANPDAHTHPRNSCTNSITHEHPNGRNQHNHNYQCQRAAQPKPNTQTVPQYNTNDYYAIQ